MAAQGFSASTVLVVEDDPDCREVVVRILEDAGYLVRAVSTSFECLNLVSAGDAFDLVICDIMMPGSAPHGFALGRMLRTRHAQQKLLYISGYIDSLPSSELSTANAPVLTKPVQASDLLDAVRRVLDGEAFDIS
jgi:CheY-like chemotaxis protein